MRASSCSRFLSDSRVLLPALSRQLQGGVGMAKAKRKGKATINALSKAKSVYAARCDVNWLAVVLKDAFRTEDGSRNTR